MPRSSQAPPPPPPQYEPQSRTFLHPKECHPARIAQPRQPIVIGPLPSPAASFLPQPRTDGQIRREVAPTPPVANSAGATLSPLEGLPDDLHHKLWRYFDAKDGTKLALTSKVMKNNHDAHVKRSLAIYDKRWLCLMLNGSRSAARWLKVQDRPLDKSLPQVYRLRLDETGKGDEVLHIFADLRPGIDLRILELVRMNLPNGVDLVEKVTERTPHKRLAKLVLLWSSISKEKPQKQLNVEALTIAAQNQEIPLFSAVTKELKHLALSWTDSESCPIFNFRTNPQLYAWFAVLTTLDLDRVHIELDLDHPLHLPPNLHSLTLYDVISEVGHHNLQLYERLSHLNNLHIRGPPSLFTLSLLNHSLQSSTETLTRLGLQFTPDIRVVLDETLRHAHLCLNVSDVAVLCDFRSWHTGSDESDPIPYLQKILEHLPTRTHTLHLDLNLGLFGNLLYEEGGDANLSDAEEIFGHLERLLTGRHAHLEQLQIILIRTSQFHLDQYPNSGTYRRLKSVTNAVDLCLDLLRTKLESDGKSVQLSYFSNLPESIGDWANRHRLLNSASEKKLLGVSVQQHIGAAHPAQAVTDRFEVAYGGVSLHYHDAVDESFGAALDSCSPLY